MLKKGIDPTSCPQARVVSAICSAAELKFADCLVHALDPKKCLVIVKVRVLDVIQLIQEPDARRMRFWHDQLSEQRFDYVICSKKTLAPLLAVELDGDEPLHRGNATRDVTKNTAAQRAGFPLVRVSAKTAHTPAQLRQKLIDGYKVTKTGPVPAEMD